MVSGLNFLMPGAPLYSEADYVPFVEGQARFDPAFFRHVAKMGYLFEEPDVIARIACPLLLMTARPMMPGATIGSGLAAFENNWRDGQHVHFPDSGHAIMFDQFVRYVETLTDFFNSH